MPVPDMTHARCWSQECLAGKKVVGVTDEALNIARENTTVTEHPALSDAKDVMANVIELLNKTSSDFSDTTLQMA